MNYNIAAYCVYLPVIFYITVYVGRALYKSGEPFLVDSFHNNKVMAKVFNMFLLTGYYLLNLGYATFSINGWGSISSFSELIEDVSTHLGTLVLLLGIMHYINMYSFTRFSKQLKRLYQNLNNHSS
jgi:hypothetical protein